MQTSNETHFRAFKDCLYDTTKKFSFFVWQEFFLSMRFRGHAIKYYYKMRIKNYFVESGGETVDGFLL